ncbi:MAG: PDZ domain-containing protein [Lewinellaceae bacterium]|nr:PDZ domain-containing protein [Lewinellaceae bacterium]
MTLQFSTRLLPLSICCFLLNIVTAQTNVKTIATFDEHPPQKNLSTPHLAEFGLLEGYQAEAEGSGVALIVKPGGLADQVGIKTGYILTEINGTPVPTFLELRRVLGEKDRYATLSFRYWTGEVYEDVQMQVPEIVSYTRLYSLKLAACYGLEVDNYQLSENGGVMITAVDAQHSGTPNSLQAGDIIIEAVGTPITTWSELYPLIEVIRRSKNLHWVPLVVNRHGKMVRLLLEPVNCPEINDGLEEPVSLGIQQTLCWTPEGTENSSGIQIGRIKPNGLAQQSGFKVGDRMLSINGVPIDNTVSMTENFSKLAGTGQTMTVRVLRETQMVDVILNVPTTHRASQEPTHEPTSKQEFREETSLQPKIFKVFPNPTSGLFTLEFSAKPGPLSVRLFKLNGALLYTEQLDDFQGDYRHQFDFSGEALGPVVVHIEQGGKVFSKVVLVE